MNKLITIDKRFEKSINLFFDLGNREKIDSYIKTSSSDKIINEYLSGISNGSKDRVSVLIGPYGKGKSHLLLVLLDKLEQLDKPFLPILISYGQQDLKQEFLLGLKSALDRAGIKDIKPDSYYTEAIKQINIWKKDYKDTYKSFESLLKKNDYSTKSMISLLDDNNKNALDLFINLYPGLTSGSVFEPLVQTDLKENFMSVNRELADRYGYAGIFVVFDEFGKYIEGHNKDGYENDMKVLQDMCELAGKSDEPQFHLTMVTHKSIKEYGNVIDKRILDGFMGIEGRIKEILYIDSLQNNYQIIANVVKKDEAIFNDVDLKKVFDDNYELNIFNHEFSENEFMDIVCKGCYPLTPVAIYLLMGISQKIAQNERTLFTFLAGNDSRGLCEILKREENNRYIGAQYIYDYFENIFREEINNTEVHVEWLKCQYALNIVESDIEKSFIKVLALITMLHKESEFPPNDKNIMLALGIDEDTYFKAKNKLIDKKILLYRGRKGICQLKNNIGVDVDDEIKRISNNIVSTLNDVECLKKVADLQYELPKRYNLEYKMTRFFAYEFIHLSDFMYYKTFDYMFEEKFSDGKIILLCEHGDDDEIEKKLESIGDSRIIVINPDKDLDSKNLLLQYEAIGLLKKDEEFINNNKAILAELNIYEQDIYFEINAILEQKYLVENGECTILCSDKRAVSVSSGREFNRFISDICEEWYGKTPKINNELINRNNISSQIKKARRKLINEILTHEDMEMYLKGTSSEATVFRAVMVNTKDDEGSKEVLLMVKDFIESAAGNKKSFGELYERLAGKNYGIRKGVISFYLARIISEMNDMPVIYCENHEVLIEASIFENIDKNPKIYSIFVEKTTIEKNDYINKLWHLFNEGATCESIDKIGIDNVVSKIIGWYRGLPRFTVSAAVGYHESEKGFLDLLKGQDKNVRELLFEKLPKIFECENYSKLFELIKSAKNNIDNKLEENYTVIQGIILSTFGGDECDDLNNILKKWARDNKNVIEGNICSDDVNEIYAYANRLRSYDRNLIIKELSKILLDTYPENWTALSINSFTEKLRAVVDEVSGIEVTTNEGNSKQFSFVDSNGKMVEKFYDDIDEDGATIFLKNAIDDAFEEFGDTIDNSQKVAVLVKMLEQVLGGE